VTREFTLRVLAIVRRIPAGRVASYGQVAALAGRPRAARAVGNIMRAAHAPGLPYHRVVAAGGRLGGFGGQELLKRERLLAEGIQFSGTRIRNFSAVSIGEGRRSPATARR
jgi:O-6-methylguanine DNA methyltransferase